MATNSFRVFATLSLSLVLGLARAQDSDSYDDPPDRAARLGYLSGDVSMQPAGEEDWAPALLNRPLTTGDKLWTERGARAEIEVGPAEVRLDGSTGFSFLNVDDDTIQMRITAGVLYVNVRALEGNDHVEIDTPNIALSVLRPGSYRVEVNDAGDATTVKISDGEAEAEGPAQNVVVHAQQAVTFHGNDNIVADWGSLGSPDDFDRWNLERDRRDERVASSRTAEYVSPDVTGYEDLDDNGSWNNEPEYGYVWTPSRVAVDWSPYRYGRWVWISPWGWSWIDDAPWGYAPFHYGRWAHVRDRWCWVPGPRHQRAVYAPALVGWVGNPGVNVSVSVGSGIGWFPLGPREVYMPGRRFSHRYVERVNVSNTVIVNRTYINEVYEHQGRNVSYRNRLVPGGVTAVPRATFTSAGRTGDRRVRIDEHELARDTGSAAPPHIDPVRESHFGGPTRVNVRVPPRMVVDRQVIVKREPPASNARFARGRGNQDSRPQERPQERPAQTNVRTQPNGAVPRDTVERPHEDRPSGQTNWRTQPAVTEPRATVEKPREDRPSWQRERPIERQQPAADRQERSEAEDRQQAQSRDAREQQQRQQQERQQQDSQPQWRNSREQPQRQQQAERQQQSERQSRQAEQREQPQQRPPQQREHPIERARPQEKPADTKPPKQRDDQPKPNRD